MLRDSRQLVHHALYALAARVATAERASRDFFDFNRAPREVEPLIIDLALSSASYSAFHEICKKQIPMCEWGQLYSLLRDWKCCWCLLVSCLPSGVSGLIVFFISFSINFFLVVCVLLPLFTAADSLKKLRGLLGLFFRSFPRLKLQKVARYIYTFMRLDSYFLLRYFSL